MRLADTGGLHTNYGPYILLVLTFGFSIIGYLVRTLIISLGALRKEQNVQSSGLAVLVERINPVGTELAEHEQRLRATENGLEHLKGALDNNQQMTQHLISLQLNRSGPG